jgi:competence transcription factor ComK
MRVKEAGGLGKLDIPAQKAMAALVPCYHSSMGNVTEVIYLDEEPVVIPRTIKTVLKNTAREYAVDLGASRKKYAEILGCRRAVPLPINPDTILMPLKMREVISKNDSCRGYINYLAVRDVTEAGRTHSLVILKDGRALKCMHSIKNVNQHLRNCHFLYQRINGASELNTNNAVDYLNYPATKSDIAMLLKEIRELREKL